MPSSALMLEVMAPGSRSLSEAHVFSRFRMVFQMFQILMVGRSDVKLIGQWIGADLQQGPCVRRVCLRDVMWGHVRKRPDGYLDSIQELF